MKETYCIPEAQRETIQKTVARIQKRAAKYGTPLSVEYGEPYATTVPVYGIDYTTGVQFKKDNAMVEVFDLTIDSEIIRKEGYTVAAKIEHLDEGNIVKTFGSKGRVEWSTMKPHCDHCNSNHVRCVTFIVEGDDGTERQVGRTCLKDYCGIDPQDIGRLNELREILEQDDIRSYDFEARPVPVAYRTIEALALAMRLIKDYGYVKTDMPGSTKGRLHELMVKHERPSENEISEAGKVADMIVAMTEDEAFDANLRNVQTFLTCGYCKADSFGYIACAPLMFERYMSRKAKLEAREAEMQQQRDTSGYVGEIGQKIEVEVADMRLVTSWETQWGMTWLYKFTDKAGNVLVWFASKPMERVNENGVYEDVTSVSRIKATVKDHTVRDGVKQTVITRCKAA